jgi:thioredoxin reductase (NADPH)
VFDGNSGAAPVLRDDPALRPGGDLRVLAGRQAVSGGARSGTDETDVIIVGSGQAGLTAAVSAAARGLRSVVLEEPLSGLSQDGYRRAVRVAGGREVTAPAVIVATGIAWRRLGGPGLEALAGSGVSYGAPGRQAGAMAGRDVFVAGAGNSAGQAALHLARYARTVTLLARAGSLARSMPSYLIQEISVTANISVLLHTEVASGHGSGRLEALTLCDSRQDRTWQAPAAGLFVLIGGVPRTQWLAGVVQLNSGYVATGRDVTLDGAGRWPLHRAPLPLETSMPGVFAAGDARYGSVKLVASAVGDGAAAVRLAQQYISAGPLAGLREPEPVLATHMRHPQVALRYL